MLARAGALPIGENWAFEPKWDGARFLLRCDGRAELFTRNANNLSSSFPEALEAAEAALAGHRVILDGEVIVLDAHGRPSFDLLSRRLRVTRPPRTLSAQLTSTLVVFCV
jgi:bifunctional non-homologous end joining protein LigD